jgi:hypothetical protein
VPAPGSDSTAPSPTPPVGQAAFDDEGNLLPDRIGPQPGAVDVAPPNDSIDDTQLVGGNGPGLISWEGDPADPYAASPSFIARFSGTPDEVALASTIVMIDAGARPVREIRGANELGLPGGRRTNYDVYSVGPPDNPGDGRIANIRGTATYYYSPYHYRSAADVPNTWIKLTYPAPRKG